MRSSAESFVLPRTLYLGKSDEMCYYFLENYARGKNTPSFLKPIQDAWKLQNKVNEQLNPDNKKLFWTPLVIHNGNYFVIYLDIHRHGFH